MNFKKAFCDWELFFLSCKWRFEPSQQDCEATSPDGKVQFEFFESSGRKYLDPKAILFPSCADTWFLMSFLRKSIKCFVFFFGTSKRHIYLQPRYDSGPNWRVTATSSIHHSQSCLAPWRICPSHEANNNTWAHEIRNEFRYKKETANLHRKLYFGKSSLCPRAGIISWYAVSSFSNRTSNWHAEKTSGGHFGVTWGQKIYKIFQ